MVFLISQHINSTYFHLEYYYNSSAIIYKIDQLTYFLGILIQYDFKLI